MTVPTAAISRLSQYNTSTSNVSYTFVGPNSYGYSTNLPKALNDVAEVADWIADIASTLVVSSDNSLDAMQALTLAEYQGLTPDDSTAYFVMD